LASPKNLSLSQYPARGLLRENKKSTYLDELENSSDDNSPGPGNYDPYVNSSFKKIKVK